MTSESPSPEPAVPVARIPSGNGLAESRDQKEGAGFLRWIKNFMRPDSEITLRETIDEYINESVQEKGDLISQHERVLLSNILKLRDMTVINVMIPRIDIVAIEIGTTQEELLDLLAEKQFSRIPVYRGTLDDVLGTIHIKDVLAMLARGEAIDIKALIKEIPIVSPAMPILDLMLTMRQSRRHIALVVDEYGGIDGLVTANDVIESIVGEIDDEHDQTEDPKIVARADGSLLVDARLPIEEFEDRFGNILTDKEREACDTLSGLVFEMTGRIPGRGEVLTHSSGMVFEVMDADPRRINLLKIRNLPAA